MFSLIITIISIALVAALALASIYYGGDAFTKGSDGATAARLINEGQQLQGARTLAASEDAFIGTNAVDTLAKLAPNYLSQIPTGLGSAWTTDADDGSSIVSGANFMTSANEAVCKEVNKKAGLGDTLSPDVTSQSAARYGCKYTSGRNPVVTVFYRY